MNILALDTSCNETSGAITQGRTVLSHLEYTQVALHASWGGVVPSLAKRAHEERIDWVIEHVLMEAKKNGLSQKSKIDAVAVTVGPGLAIALEVGIRAAKSFSVSQNIPVIPINHMSGHIYSCFAQNTNQNPSRPFLFPYLALLVSGGHTELVLMKDHHQFELLGETRDDAVGESLDKAARMLGFGYPGGPIIERTAETVSNDDMYRFTRPMLRTDDLDFSFAGLKTAFLYFTQNMNEKERQNKLAYLASSYQEAAFDSIVKKVERAVRQTGVPRLIVGGGVAVNKRLRFLLKQTILRIKGQVLFPTYRYLNFDNAAMIGVAAAFLDKKKYIDPEHLDYIDRIPRYKLG